VGGRWQILIAHSSNYVRDEEGDRADPVPRRASLILSRLPFDTFPQYSHDNLHCFALCCLIDRYLQNGCDCWAALNEATVNTRRVHTRVWYVVLTELCTVDSGVALSSYRSLFVFSSPYSRVPST
jgi:hypothetical protein